MPKDEVALMQQVHDEHADVLWRFCLSLVGNDRGRAEDVVQETLLRAWRHRTVLEGSPSAVRSWLFTVARNIVIDEWRSRRARPETPVEEVPEQRRSLEDDESDQLLLSWVVAEALTHLSADHRTVLLQCYYRGRPVAEVARLLGVPPGTVKSRTHYALRALKLALEEMGVTA
jgi:RNA polymerase sigma-70 factor (ECF subfamily)